MELKHLYIENFMCHENSFIDFTEFTSALIIGKKDNNDLYSNGVGKTTIFKALEYVLFNQADVNLEDLIKDDAQYAVVVLDFIVDGKEYRLSRKRTKKGATDLSLYSKANSDEIEYHSESNKIPITDKKDWKDISGSRASDVEKNLGKLIKINFKSFRSTVHFMQNDFSGLASLPTEKRKGILKEALSLAVYSKLEKIAKDKLNIISKDIDKNRTILGTIGDPKTDISSIKSQLKSLHDSESILNAEISSVADGLQLSQTQLFKVKEQQSSLNNLLSASNQKLESLNNERKRIEISVKEYSTKKSNAIKSAKETIEQLKELKKSQESLSKIDYSTIEAINELISSKKEELTTLNILIKNNKIEIEERQVPMPTGSVCKHCRQSMSEKHRKDCQDQIDLEITKYKSEILESSKKITEVNAEINKLSYDLNKLRKDKESFISINSDIDNKNNELESKKSMHLEYSGLLEKFSNELKTKQDEISKLEQEIANIAGDKRIELSVLIDRIEKESNGFQIKKTKLSDEINKIATNSAILKHTLELKNKDVLQIEKINSSLKELEDKYKVYPDIVQAFSSTGIPNVIIQNVLDDLQIESNNLLGQLRPGLQLSFIIEKTKDDGTESDTLDIKYHLNGKERHYNSLSGAMKLAIMFSLKLGLYFLLQKLIGIDLKFLLLDEIDQSLDKASVDAFADMIKFFSKDFTVLVITHNDRLKDKFKNIILVSQNSNEVSKANVITNW